MSDKELDVAATEVADAKKTTKAKITKSAKANAEKKVTKSKAGTKKAVTSTATRAKKSTSGKDKANKSSGNTLKVTLAKSLIGCKESHRACAKGLGLRRREHTVEVLDTPENRGMINKISYLLKVE